MKRERFLLTINVIVFGIALMLLVGIVAVLFLVFLSGAGMIFGMMFAYFFPGLLMFAVVGAVVYVALFVSNAWITFRRKKAVTVSRQLGYIWLVFGGLTSTVVLITPICGVFSIPLVRTHVEIFKRSNPFLTAPVRSVPTYPTNVLQDQSQYDEWGETLFRSYNVNYTHPDNVAGWYQSALSQWPWSVVQVGGYTKDQEYIGRVVYHCIQAQRSEGNGQQRTYYLEIFGGDEVSFWGTHVNIGTPNPITDVCERFFDKP